MGVMKGFRHGLAWLWRRWRRPTGKAGPRPRGLGGREAAPAWEEGPAEADEAPAPQPPSRYWVEGRPEACPACGTAPVAEVVLGLVDLEAPAWREAERRGEVVWWGCLVSGEEPDWVCTACGARLYGAERRVGALCGPPLQILRQEQALLEERLRERLEVLLEVRLHRP